MTGHTPLEAPAFNGIYARGLEENTPPDHAIDSLNVKHDNEQIETRDGFALDITVSSVLRKYLYRRENEVTRTLYLRADGKLYDSTNTIAPLLDIATMTDFSAVTMYNRVYITPHDGVKGLLNEVVYVYDGTDCRPAAGSPPSATPIVAANSSAAGKVEDGTRVFAVAYETTSGFITAPGGFVSLNCTGEKQVDLSSIPTGPTGTIARHIIATKVIDSYNGDTENQAYFFVPGGTIENNTATTLTVDFYDADLQESADYLFDQLDEIPAGVGIGEFNGRLIVWGEREFPSILRASYPNEPEAFDEVEGYVSIRENDGGGTMQNTFVLRDQLYLLKEYRTYITSDSGDNAAFWPLNDIDSALGAYPHSIAGTYEKPENVIFDSVLVANPSGLWKFVGIYPEVPLSWKFDRIWKRINKNYFHKVELLYDVYKMKVYIVVPLDSASDCNHMFVMDFSKGMTPADVKWSIWQFPDECSCITLDINTTTKTSVLRYGHAGGNIYKQVDSQRNDYSNVINSYYRFAYIKDGDMAETHFAGIQLKAVGSGELDITVYVVDDGYSITPYPLTLASTAEYLLQRKFILVTYKASVKLSVNALNEWFKINRAIIYAKEIWPERPES